MKRHGYIYHSGLKFEDVNGSTVACYQLVKPNGDSNDGRLGTAVGVIDFDNGRIRRMARTEEVSPEVWMDFYEYCMAIDGR